MSLYEVMSMVRSMERRRNAASAKPTVSDEEWQNAQDLLLSVTKNDPSVSIH